MAFFFREALAKGVPLGMLMFPYYALFYDDTLAYNVWRGVTSGVLFGVFMAAFAVYQERRLARHDPRAPGEELLKRGVANHRRNGESVGGHLYLTEGRLLFRSHDLNLRDHELSIPLGEVSSARPRLTAGFVPNGLEVVWSGEKERFAVRDPRGWAKELRERLDRPSR